MKKPWEIHHDESVGEEGGMALSNLNRSQSMIGQLQDIIDSEDSLPAWVQAKLNSVYEDLDDVHGYMTYLSDHEEDWNDSEFEDEDSEFEDEDSEFEDEDSEFEDEDSEEMTEGRRKKKRRRKKKKKGLWANIWARRKAGKRPKRPGEKGYPKTLNIENSERREEQLIKEMVHLILEKRKKKKKKKCKGTESSPVGSPRQRSFCKRMCGMRRVNTGAKTAKDKDSCINQALRRWRCRCSKLPHFFPTSSHHH